MMIIIKIKEADHMQFRLRNVEICEVDPIDGEVEILFEIGDNYKDTFILTFKNYTEPYHIYRQIDISDTEYIMRREKSLEKHKKEILRELLTNVNCMV
jgi:hypothetical protein